MLLPGLVAATLSTIALLLAAFALPESNRSARSRGPLLAFDVEGWRAFAQTRALRLAGLSLAVLMCTLASLAPILVLVGRDRFGLGSREVGYLFGLMGIIVVALQLTAVDRMARRFGDVGTALIGAAALLLGLLPIPFTREPAILIACTCLMGIGQGLCNPTLSAFISKVAASSHRGSILGISSSLTALARVIGPALAGLAYDSFATPGALFSQAAVVVIAIVLAVRLNGLRQESALPAAPSSPQRT
jgi:predicted MFS family arabinose efflux permease